MNPFATGTLAPGMKPTSQKVGVFAILHLPACPDKRRFLTTLPDGAQFIESHDRYRKLSAVLSIMPGNAKQ